jgi:electron transport complex protein RnfC
VNAPTGCELRAVLEAAGASCVGRRLFVGAVLRRRVAGPSDIVGPGEQVIHVAPPPDTVMPTSCTRCGWCADVCPVRALPAMLLEAAQRRDPELADHSGLDACIDCGLCEQVCPSRLPLLRGIQLLRRSVRPAMLLEARR